MVALCREFYFISRGPSLTCEVGSFTRARGREDARELPGPGPRVPPPCRRAAGLCSEGAPRGRAADRRLSVPGLMRDAEEAWKQAGRLRLGERPRPHSQLGELLARPDTTMMIVRKRRLTAAVAAGKRCFGAVPRGLHAHGMQTVLPCSQDGHVREEGREHGQSRGWTRSMALLCRPKTPGQELSANYWTFSVVRTGGLASS